MHRVAELVGHHLHFDVARLGDVLLDVHAVITKRRLRFRAYGAQRRLQFLRLVHQPHALAAAARRGLQHHGKTNVVAGLGDLLGSVEGATGAGDHRHASLLHQRPGRDFVPHLLHGFGARPNEDDAGVGTTPGKLRVLGEKAVAGVDGVGAAAARRTQDVVDRQIAVACRRRADRVSVIRLLDVQRGAIGFGEDRYRFDVEFPARADDTHRDLGAVGDEDALKHRESWVVGRGSSVVVRARNANDSRSTNHDPPYQSGMLPCFLGGFLSRLLSRISRARISFGRVSSGMMISST